MIFIVCILPLLVNCTSVDSIAILPFAHVCILGAKAEFPYLLKASLLFWCRFDFKTVKWWTLWHDVKTWLPPMRSTGRHSHSFVPQIKILMWQINPESCSLLKAVLLDLFKSNYLYNLCNSLAVIKAIFPRYSATMLRTHPEMWGGVGQTCPHCKKKS